MATTLLDWGAHVDARNNNSLTPLHYAASNGHVELAKLFLARGADPYAKSRAGLTPLDKAQGRPTMVALLRDTIRRTGRRPGAGTLIPAAVRNDLRGILTALVAGEDVNATDDDGWTALHYAASLGLLAVTRLLLERGASQEVRDHAGLTASQVAAQAGRADVVQSLSDWAHVQVQRAHEEQVAAAAHALAQAQAQMAANGAGLGGHTPGAVHGGHEDVAPDMDVGPPEDGEDEGEWVATEEDYERYAQYLDDEAEDAGAFFRSKAGSAAMAAAVAGGGLVASPRAVKPRPVATAPPAMNLAPQGSSTLAVHAPGSAAAAAAAAAAAGAGKAHEAVPHEGGATPGSALSAATAKVAADAADMRLDAHTRAAAAAQLRTSLAANRVQVEGQADSVSSRNAPAGDYAGAAAPPASYTGGSRHDRRHRSQHGGSTRKGKAGSGGGSGMTQLRFWVTAAAAAATVLLLRAAMPSQGSKWEDEYDDDDWEDEPEPPAAAAPASGGVKSH